MNAVHIGRRIGALLAVGVLAACADGQASQSATVPNVTNSDQRNFRKMANSSEDLIYATGACGGTCVFSYSTGKLVGTLSAGGDGAYLCSDSAGDVFITHNSTVTEYAHGATSPTETLDLDGDAATGCSVDSTTGNLAVVFEGSGANVAIFPQAQGTPSLYNTHIDAYFCAYDSAGDLFVNGYFSGEKYGLAELPNGSSTFSQIAVDQSVGEPVQLQWDGDYLTWESGRPDHVTISRLSIAGSSASIDGTTKFDIKRRAQQSWIYGNKVILPYSNNQLDAKRVGVWNYPKGGEVTKKMDLGTYKKNANLWGVTVSVGGSE